MKNYYILSLKHSPSRGMAVWWGPHNSGYYCDIESAGLYTQEQIDANPTYYNNGVTTLAVEEVDVVQASRRTVDWSKVRPMPQCMRDKKAFGEGRKS